MSLKSFADSVYEWYIRTKIRNIPAHVAVIQDGNRRFAREKGIEISMGHRMGADATERMLDWVHDLGIRHITIYCFSTENFKRSESEVIDLLSLFMEKFATVREDERVHRYGIRVRMIGDRSLVPPRLLETIDRAEKATENYSNHYLNVALAYGGRNEIVHAARSIIWEVRDGLIEPPEIDTETVESHINRGLDIPPVDLIIRTGDEHRTSNFLPWLANGNECAVYFCAPYWPLFRKIDLLRAIRVYDQRVCLSGS